MTNFYSDAVLSGQTSTAEDKIICAECGGRYHQLSVHLGAKHKLSAEEYRTRYPGAPTISKWASSQVSAAQKGTTKGSSFVPTLAASVAAVLPESPLTAPSNPTPALVIAGASSAPIAGEWLQIGSAKLPVWSGWSAWDADQVPDHDEHYQLDEKLLSHIAVGIELMENILITGPTGSGKTTVVKALAAILNWPVTRINLNGDTRAADMVGDMSVVIDAATGQAKTEWQDGPLVTAMRNGHLCLVDELDAANPSVHFVMQRVTERHHDPIKAIADGKPHATLLLPTGEVVKAHPNFRLIATANTVGAGDLTGDYVATNVMNQAFLDRWGIKVHVGYPSASTWKNILKFKTGLDAQRVSYIVDIAEKVNKGKADAQCRVGISPRKTLTWARLAAKFNGDLKLGAELSILNGIDPMDGDRQFVQDIIKQILG